MIIICFLIFSSSQTMLVQYPLSFMVLHCPKNVYCSMKRTCNNYASLTLIHSSHVHLFSFSPPHAWYSSLSLNQHHWFSCICSHIKLTFFKNQRTSLLFHFFLDSLDPSLATSLNSNHNYYLYNPCLQHLTQLHHILVIFNTTKLSCLKLYNIESVHCPFLHFSSHTLVAPLSHNIQFYLILLFPITVWVTLLHSIIFPWLLPFSSFLSQQYNLSLLL